MINAVLSDSSAAQVGCDGQLTTREWACYEIGQLKLWDSPAINKRSEENERNKLTINTNVRPDMIWFIVNYKSADIDDQHKIYETPEFSEKIPAIVIINKVDNLRKMRNLSFENLLEFSQRASTSVWLSQHKLTQMRDTIYDTWQNFINLKAVTVTSLTCEDDDLDENVKPIGIDVLLHITSQHLENDDQKLLLNLLKQQNKSYKRNSEWQDESK